MRYALLTSLAAAALLAGSAQAARPKLSDLPLVKSSDLNFNLAAPAQIATGHKIPGLLVRLGNGRDEHFEQSAVEVADLLDSTTAREAPIRPDEVRAAVAARKRPAVDDRWITVKPKTGCVAQDRNRHAAKLLTLPSKSGVVKLQRRRIEWRKGKPELVTTFMAVDTTTLGAAVLKERRIRLRRLGTGDGKFALYGYRTAKSVELVTWAPGAQVNAVGRSIGSTFSSCGLLRTTLSTKRSAASVDIGAERQLPLTKDEKRDADRGVATTRRVEASFAHVSVSKLHPDRTPVLSVVVRKESALRLPPGPRRPMAQPARRAFD